MAFRIGKEAQKRVAREHSKARIQRTASLIARLEAKVSEHGTNSIWADMLAETRAKQ